MQRSEAPSTKIQMKDLASNRRLIIEGMKVLDVVII